MSATYTFDIFCTLDGYGSYGPAGDWGGYWGKQGPELLGRRLASFEAEQRMVFGATTFREFVKMLAASTEKSDVRDRWGSEVPLRSHGSLSLNRALMAAGLVDLIRVTVFPVISGKTGTKPIFKGAGDFDLEIVESRTLDGNIQELIYRPTLHG